MTTTNLIQKHYLTLVKMTINLKVYYQDYYH
ncbi:Uncharacterised protein [Mycobacteroides abscessus]|nr:Uncharacterised protein [Mycobacteroides abscessus]